MSIKRRGLIIYRNPDAFHKEADINPYPHRMRKHDLRLNSIGLDDTTLSELHRIKRRSYLQKTRFIFSYYIQNHRHIVRCLTQMSALKKLTLQFEIYGEDFELNVEKFKVFKQLVKKLFTRIKRTIALQVIVDELLPASTNIMKHLTRLNKLVKLEILFMSPTLNCLSYLDNFLTSSRTKKTLPKLQSLHVNLTHQWGLTYTSPDFTNFAENIAKINSSLQSYPQAKSSLRLSSLSSESTVPTLLEILSASPQLISFDAKLDLAENYLLLFDKLETLNQLNSLQLTIDPPLQRNVDAHQLSKRYGEYFTKVKSLKELKLSLTQIKQAYIISQNFMNQLKVFTQLQKLSLSFDWTNLNDDAIYRLSQTLSSFPDLQSFKFMNFQPPDYNIYEPSDRILDLLEALKSRKPLEVIYLDFQNLGMNINNAILSKLCEILENLVQLRELKFMAQGSKIDDQRIIEFAQTLPKAINLEKISLDFCFGERMENDTLVELLESFSLLKHLRRIDLGISCSEITSAAYETVILLLNKLRSLSFFKLTLVLDQRNFDIESKFEELLERQHQYQKVFEFYFL